MYTGSIGRHVDSYDGVVRLVFIKAEIEALLRGHSKEAKANVLDKRQPWYVRISLLYLEQKTIYESLTKQLERDQEQLYASSPWYSESQKQDLETKIKVFEAEKGELESAPKFGSTECMIQRFSRKKNRR